jgi:hypothetical protein
VGKFFLYFVILKLYTLSKYVLPGYEHSNVGGTQLVFSQVKFEKQVQKTSFLLFPDIFEDDFDRARSKIEAQSGLRPVWYMKNMLASCFGVP